MTTPLALVTGASSGIGAAVAARLLQRSYQVWGAARRTPDCPAGAAGDFRLITLDLTDEFMVEVALETVLDKAGRLDVLVNNAGYGLYGAVEDVPLAEARRQFEVNLFGLAAATRIAIPAMRAQGGGTVINVSSVAGRLSTPLAGWYAASKHALEALSDALRHELAPFGIRVVLIEPGAIRTGFTDVAFPSLARPDGRPEYRPLAEALRRLVTRSYARAPGPEVVADAVERAIGARRPRPRYTLPADARLLTGMRRLLGDRLLDAAMRSQLRL